jgi:hypothetical protein
MFYWDARSTAAAAKLLGDAIAAEGETVAKATLTGEGMVAEAPGYRSLDRR